MSNLESINENAGNNLRQRHHRHKNLLIRNPIYTLRNEIESMLIGTYFTA